MVQATTPKWSFEGEYFENCNCAVACPCVVSTNAPFTSNPTEGACEVTFAFHVNRGSFGDASIDGLNVAVLARTPGPMMDGNWSVALYLDERADDRQRDALTAIFSGAAGGTMGGFAPLFGEFLGAKTVPITYAVEGTRRSVAIPGVMSVAVRPIPSAIGADKEMVAVNAHPFAPDGVVMAYGDSGNSVSDYGFNWDNSGKTGLYAPIRWSNG